MAYRNNKFVTILGLFLLTLLSPSATTPQVAEAKAPAAQVNATEEVVKAKPKLTGIPQIDYIHDPNLPYEVKGYDLSDYPFYGRVPNVDFNFTCDDRLDGFYASIPHKCQVYHNCLFSVRYDFLCPNFTVFDQTNFICHFASQVDCADSEAHYYRNEALYKEEPKPTVPPQVKIVYIERQRKRRPGNKNHPRNKPKTTTADPTEDYYYDYYEDDPQSNDYVNDPVQPIATTTTSTTTTTTTRRPIRTRKPNRPLKTRTEGQGGGQRNSPGRQRPGNRQPAVNADYPDYGPPRGQRPRNQNRPQRKRRRRRKKTTTTTAAPEYYDEYYDYYYDDDEPSSTTTARAQPPPRRRGGSNRRVSNSERRKSLLQSRKSQFQPSTSTTPAPSPADYEYIDDTRYDDTAVAEDVAEVVASAVEQPPEVQNEAEAVPQQTSRGSSRRPGSFRRPSSRNRASTN